jgi:hypothetical protein
VKKDIFLISQLGSQSRRVRIDQHDGNGCSQAFDAAVAAAAVVVVVDVVDVDQSEVGAARDSFR